MRKAFQFEEIRLCSISLFMFMSIMYISIFGYIIPFNEVHYDNLFSFCVTIAVFSIYNLIRYKFFSTSKYTSDLIFLIYGLIDLFYVSYYFNIATLDQGGKMVIMFLLIISSIYRGRKVGIILTLFWFPIEILSNLFFIYFIINLPKNYFTSLMTFTHIINSIYFQIILLILVIISHVIYKNILNKEKENKDLFDRLKFKYMELNFANDQIEAKNESLKKANDDLEDLNAKLTDRIAEFFTLQQITNAIGTILNIDELIKYVNDVLLGVMGVKDSTIILFNKENDKLEVHTTNITDKNDFQLLTRNIDDVILKNVLKDGNILYDNNLQPDKFSFTNGRNVKSLICVPIVLKNKSLGLILLEQDFENAFDENKIKMLIVIAHQIGMAMENADLYNQMQEFATTDNLTGAFNRLYFNRRLEEEFKAAQDGGYELSLAMLDIDHFKRFNDTYGHLFGDKVLKSICQTINGSIRDQDIMARFGGEEFVILFPNTSISEAYEIVENIRENIKHTTVNENEVCVSVTASLGLASFPQNASDTIDLIKNADDALYDAKNSGRNCVKVSEKTKTDIIKIQLS